MGASHKSSNTYYKDRPQKIEDCLFYGLELDDEQLQFANAIWSPDIDIVFCNARAGTGKTTIAAGVATLLVQYGDFDQIIYIMSPYGERCQGPSQRKALSTLKLFTRRWLTAM